MHPPRSPRRPKRLSPPAPHAGPDPASLIDLDPGWERHAAALRTAGYTLLPLPGGRALARRGSVPTA